MDEDALFPEGTPVCVRQRVRCDGDLFETEIVGVVESWEDRPTGSWYAHSRDDRLHLKRLRLRKPDGEEVLLVIDDATEIARLEPAS